MSGSMGRAAPPAGGKRSTGFQGNALDAVFRAKSVAMVGISADAAKLNGIPLQLLRMGGFLGPVYLVNPKYEEIAGLKCYPDLESLPEAPEMVLSMVPASQTPGIVDASGRIGARAVIVFASGFEEAGGATLAKELKDAADHHGIALIGPNCEGVWSVRQQLILTFGSAAHRETFHYAPISVISQSGAMAGAIARHLQDSGLGCAYIVSVGNETCVDGLEILDWMLDQDDVRVVLMFIEGLRDGSRLLALGEKARQKGIRIAALKSGNSEAGRNASGTHTGKIASEYEIYQDVFEQAGVIQVAGLAELVEAGEVLSQLPAPKTVEDKANAGIAVFSIPGGTRALTADICEKLDVPLARFDPATVESLTRVLPAFGQAVNPTDMTGQILSRPELFEQALGLVASDPNTEAVVIQLANRGPRDVRARREAIARLAGDLKLPVVVSMLGDVLPPEERITMARSGVVAAKEPADAVRYLSWLYAARRFSERPKRVPSKPSAATADPGTSWEAASRYLAEAGIDVVPFALATNSADAITAAKAITAPYVVKALPEHVEHKTELGLVEIGLGSPEKVGEVIASMQERIGRPDTPVLIQQFVRGVEVLLAVTRDPDFGPVLAIGTGGIGVELWRDVAYLALPAEREDILRAVRSLKLAKVLDGFRGSPAADLNALVNAAQALSEVALRDAGKIDEIELNPFILRGRGEGGVAVDVLIRLRS